MAKAKTGELRITLVRSLIGCKKDQIATANSLGLRRPGDESVQPNNAATQGAVRKVAPYVKVEEV